MHGCLLYSLNEESFSITALSPSVEISLGLRVLSVSAIMRLRFLWPDYFEEASKAAGQCYQQNQLPVPVPSFCLFPAAGCAALVSSWLLTKLLGGLPVMVGNALEMHQLCISMVQAHFLSAVLPHKLAQPWALQQKDSLSYFSEIGFLPQDIITRELNLRCSPHFESMVLDLPQQNDLARIVVSEVSSILGGFVSTWESQLRKGYGDKLSIFYPETGKGSLSRQIKNTLTKERTGAEMKLVFHGCTHSSSIFQDKSSLRLSVLEAPKMDEAFTCSDIPSLSQEVYIRTLEMGGQLAHTQLINIINLLESEYSQLAAKLFTLKFCEQLPMRSKDFQRSCGSSHMQLLDFLWSGKASMNFPLSLARCEKGLPMLELPVPLWELKKFIASWRCKCFLKVFDMSHQCVCVHTPKILDSNHSEKFETLIVGPELVYKDYVFSSLAVPVLREKVRSCIATEATQEALSGFKHAVPLALNFLYLDWHFSHKKDCGKQPCFMLESRLLEIGKYKPLKFATPHQRNADIHAGFSEKIIGVETKWSLEKESPVCSPKHSCSLESRESACPLLPACQVKPPERAVGVGVRIPARSPNKHLDSSKIEAFDAKKLSQDMFACNELTFFLQARQGTVNGNAAVEGSDKKRIPEVEHLALCNTKVDYQVHSVVLSEPILKLRACLELDYLRIYQNDANLAHELQSSESLNSLHTEADAKAALILLIKERAKNQNTPNEQQLLRGLIALYILQQTAENLCMYGIQVGHLYMESWYLNLRFLQDLVCCSYAECEEAYRQVEKGLLLDHPKLTCLGDILSKHKCKVWNPKILVIAERRALFTLYKKIISCSLKPYQFDREENLLQNNTPSTDLLNQAVTEALLKCDCLMVPPEYITKSFPIKEFSCIIQYGHFSSTIEDSNSAIQSSGSEVHILQITAKDLGGNIGEKVQCSEEVLQKVFSDDRGSTPALQNAGKLRGKVQQELPMEGSTSSHNKPDLEMDVFAKSTDTMELDNTSAFIFPATDILSNIPFTYRQCEMNIVVNINQSYNFLLSGQRSSYQKILALEKEGMNVVERDLCLPIDMILSPAVCLIWYTKEKLSNSEPASGQLMPLACIEGITNNSMKALSFSFRTCIMIFEGPSEFVAEAMQMFGYLQAAAVGLDIQLQCFISGSSSTTDIIISDCILELKRLRKTSSAPAMLEAETLAESFLTAFASINALTGHAILSCGIELCQFMSLKVEEQLRLTELFDLSERSLLLFKRQAQSGSSGRVHKGAKRVCSGDHFNTTQSKIRKTSAASNKASLPEERLIQSQQNHLTDIEEDWHPRTGLRKTAVDNDDLLPKSDLWLVENDIDGKNSCLGSTHITKQRVHPFDSPFQFNTCPPHEHDKKLKRTIDLILQRNSSKVGKCIESTNEAKSCMKSPAAKIAKGSWLELDEENSPNAWLHSPVGSVLSPELDPGTTLKMDTGLAKDARRSSCGIRNQYFQRTTPNSRSPYLEHSQKLHSSIYNEQVYKKAMEVDLEDLFDFKSKDISSRHDERECPMEFANETREHLKRKLDFESPTSGKRFNRCSWERQESLNSKIFDKYRYEGREQSEVQKLNSERHSRIHLFNSPQKSSQQDACTEKCVSCKNPKIRKKTYSNSKRGLPWTNPKPYKGPAHSKGLCPSWTPYDKRSNKVLSFERKGNDCQSRLVWESSQDVSGKGKSFSPYLSSQDVSGKGKSFSPFLR